MSTVEITKEWEVSKYNILPKMYLANDNECLVTASSYARGYYPYLAFNRTMGGYNLWHSDEEPKPDWIRFDFPKLVKITDYWFTTRVNDENKFPLCVPKTVELFVGDTSAEEMTAIDMQTDIVYPFDEYITVRVHLDSVIEAQSFKLVIHDTYFPKNKYVNISEIQYIYYSPEDE